MSLSRQPSISNSQPKKRNRRPTEKQRQLDETQKASDADRAKKRSAGQDGSDSQAAKRVRRAATDTQTFTSRTVTSSTPKQARTLDLNVMKRTTKVPQLSRPVAASQQARPQRSAATSTPVRLQRPAASPAPLARRQESGMSTSLVRQSRLRIDTSSDEEEFNREEFNEEQYGRQERNEEQLDQEEFGEEERFEMELDQEAPNEEYDQEEEVGPQAGYDDDSDMRDGNDEAQADDQGFDEEGDEDGDKPDGDEDGDEEGDEDGDEDDIPFPVPIVANSGRPRAKDYDKDVQAILDIANQLFRCRVSTINAFPGPDQEVQWAQLSWGEACRQLNYRYAASPRIIKIITALESLYGFKNSSSAKAIRENRELAENLKRESAFVYEEPALGQNNYDARKGMYRSPIIQKAVNAMWFANKNDEGVRYRKFFDPFSLETLALVLTAVQCGIDEWGGGARTTISFNVNDYHSVYDTHKANLKAFDRLCDDAHEVLLDIRQELHTEARFHSGAEAIDTTRKLNTIPRDALTSALRQALDAKAQARNGDE
ncbi:uncharacterized protein C8Q71DRAFT_855096 [Rhodofomes roseus]|uniref:DUF6532 domain-containing protein n=1 Tax=Rhodofomes roseus TaxID=34475 RepID=A0ABQ8KN83_9APHY|nr:uncharacterized protein C8Q71DRAFT_855096 [Rhodofomes roseus]KAH9839786.1 hypothetical protein C8Q71DRAFT_855096 [Rhodofomes roseus]